MRDSRLKLHRVATAFVATLIAAGTAVAVAAAPAAGQQAPDSRWQPWIGCWQLAPQGDAAARQPAEATVLCIAPEGSGVRLTSYAGGKQVDERHIVADGRPEQISDAGCTGTGTARWSEDGFRVFLESDLSCGTRGDTHGSGVMAMLPGARWLDVRSVTIEDQPLMRVQRYELADEQTMRAAGVPADLTIGQQTPETLARMAAASPLSTEDVVEASEMLRPEVLQVLLAERHAGFNNLDAATLEHLADAGVPGEVTDVMVALSNPDRFVVDAGSGVIGSAEEQGRERGREHVAYIPGRRVYTGWDCGGAGFDPYWGNPWSWGFGYGSSYDPYCGGYGFGYGPYSPYGYGYGYGWYSYAPGRVIVVRGTGQSDAGGSAVPGHGYTHRGGSSGARVAHPRVTSSGYRGPSSARSGGSSGGGASSGGHSAPVRHAHPRGSHH